jgi:hypothetical protein
MSHLLTPLFGVRMCAPSFLYRKEQHMPNERLGLSRVPTRLRDDFKGSPPTHPAVYAAAVNGRIPAIWERGRWYVDQADLPRIAEAFGMTPRELQTA